MHAVINQEVILRFLLRVEVDGSVVECLVDCEHVELLHQKLIIFVMDVHRDAFEAVEILEISGGANINTVWSSKINFANLPSVRRFFHNFVSQIAKLLGFINSEIEVMLT